MVKAFIPFLLLVILQISTLGCDRPACKNTNPVFETHSPDTKAYKDELIRQLSKADRSKLSYWMNAYRKYGNAVYIWANVQGDGLCAQIMMTVKDSDKGIKGILQTKGRGYRGAELKDLRFDVYQDSAKTEFIFKEISGLID